MRFRVLLVITKEDLEAFPRFGGCGLARVVLDLAAIKES
jgi:hypothetical protein